MEPQMGCRHTTPSHRAPPPQPPLRALPPACGPPGCGRAWPVDNHPCRPASAAWSAPHVVRPVLASSLACLARRSREATAQPPLLCAPPPCPPFHGGCAWTVANHSGRPAGVAWSAHATAFIGQIPRLLVPLSTECGQSGILIKQPWP